MKIDRKKEVKNKNRNKWIIGGVILFASVALIGSGFATWVIGNTSTQGSGDVNITVDNAAERNVELSAVIDPNDNSIELKEVNTTDPNLIVKVTEGLDAANMGFAFSDLTISYPEQTGFEIDIDLADESKIVVSQATLKDADGNDVRNAWAEGASGWTYIDFAPYHLDILPNMMTASGEGENTVYSYNAATDANASMNFTWGTFFNNQAPTTFYNGLFTRTENPIAVNDTNKGAIVTELNAMKTAYDAVGTLTVVIKVSPYTA